MFDPNWVIKTYVEYGEIIFDILTVHREAYENTPQQVDFIVSLLRKYHPDAVEVLDVPCGDGRISLGFLERGYRVTGMDISPSYIRIASEKGQKHPGSRFLVGDMREMNLSRKFDVVINWFSSFGYFDEATNQRVLENFIDHLKEGGVLILDILNRDHYIQKMAAVIYEWRPEILVRTRKGNFSLRYSFDPYTSRLTVEVKGENLSEPLYYSMRLYSLHELIKMLKSRNMEVLEVYGDYSGSKYRLFSPRIIIVARKKYHRDDEEKAPPLRDEETPTVRVPKVLKSGCAST
ncbi:class I SAM-dependent methyltransferase [Thermococcus sp.]|uniref:class I SAM-dependent methyltransferase n=1 Tax=Thermococcus sp. TaxID=35749 RepID=UPI002635A6C7|nr:class I SAM-dependent methyltransferase [Thermococcus sp.]